MEDIRRNFVARNGVIYMVSHSGNWRSCVTAFITMGILALAPVCSAADNDNWNADDFVKNVTDGKLSSVDDLRSGDPAEVERVVFSLLGAGENDRGKLDRERAALFDAAGDNPRLEAFYRAILMRYPQMFENSRDREIVIDRILYFRKRWAVDFLGELLMTDEKLGQEEPGNEYIMRLVTSGYPPGAPNCVHAMDAMQNMGLREGPSEGVPLLREWREWWTQNSNRVDEMLAQPCEGYRSFGVLRFRVIAPTTVDDPTTNAPPSPEPVQSPGSGDVLPPASGFEIGNAPEAVDAPAKSAPTLWPVIAIICVLVTAAVVVTRK